MSNRPIIFSKPMVQALLDGRKTQTRRLVRIPKWAAGSAGTIETDEHGRHPQIICDHTGCFAQLPTLAVPGDRLWVRENWQLHSRASDLCTVVYAATIDRSWAETHDQFPDALAGKMMAEPFQGGWRPSIHMPRWASRLTLVVTDVRVQKLLEIDPLDAIEEGAMTVDLPTHGPASERGRPALGQGPVARFRHLWEHLHGAEGWSANPYVAALTFTVRAGNIDRLQAADARELEHV